MKDETTITVVINAYNEEQHIGPCIESARKLSESIVVIDTESTDSTASLVKKMSIPVYSFPLSRYVEPSREYGISKAPGAWVFILDADERITDELADEIKTILQSTDKTHFKIHRRNIFGKHTWLQHGGWWPDQQLRLIKKDCFKSWPSEIHSVPSIEGERGEVSSYMLHFTQNDLELMLRKRTTVYEEIEARLLYKAHKPVSVSTFFRKYIAEFYRRMIKNAAWKDGAGGIISAIYQAYSKTITYLFLYEKYQENTHH